jgi:DDE_Tnp_1-associated
MWGQLRTDDWVDIEAWGNEKITWLKQILALENGIAWPDTFGRVLSRLDAEAFQAAFLGWAQSAYEISEGQVSAIDGKQGRPWHDCNSSVLDDV